MTKKLCFLNMVIGKELSRHFLLISHISIFYLLFLLLWYLHSDWIVEVFWNCWNVLSISIFILLFSPITFLLAKRYHLKKKAVLWEIKLKIKQFLERLVSNSSRDKQQEFPHSQSTQPCIQASGVSGHKVRLDCLCVRKMWTEVEMRVVSVRTWRAEHLSAALTTKVYTFIDPADNNSARKKSF